MRLSLPRMLAAVLTCALATSCMGGSVGGGEEEGQGKPDSIKWLIETPEDAKALKALKKHVGTFEEESGIKVEVKTMPSDNMRTVLQTQLRSGKGPDVFNWGSGPGFGGALAEAGLVHDLSSAYEKHDWQVYDFAKERVTQDGKVYGIPGEMETVGLFYNKDIFEKHDLEAPESLADLRAAAKKIKQSGTIPMAVSDKEGWQGGHYLSMALSSEVGSDGMKDLIDGKKSWNSPDVVRALQVWKDFNDSGYLNKSPTSVNYDSGNSSFLSGKAAMLPTGSWMVGEIDDTADFEVGYVPFPASDGEGTFAGGLGSGPFVSASSTKKKAAIEFLDFLASPQHARWTVENLHTIPPTPLDTDDVEVSPLFAQVLDDVSALSDGGDMGYNIDVMSSDQFNEAMYDGVQAAAFTGQSTPAEVAEELEAASKK